MSSVVECLFAGYSRRALVDRQDAGSMGGSLPACVATMALVSAQGSAQLEHVALPDDQEE